MNPNIVVYCCSNSTALPENEVEKLVSEGKAVIRMVRLPCSGRSDVLYIVRAIEEGADMALIVGCPEDRCQYLQGSLRAKQRVGYANRILNEAGVGLDRVKMITLDPSHNDPSHDGQFAAVLEEVITKATELGPWLPQ